tara:strand:- start:672 stop:1058 length:387 start_codon:yes stop_codon:yes gene_type:complete
MQPDKIRKLLPSIEQFELGDGGGPASLIAFNAERFRGQSGIASKVVHPWFYEEREHGRESDSNLHHRQRQVCKGAAGDSIVFLVRSSLLRRRKSRSAVAAAQCIPRDCLLAKRTDDHVQLPLNVRDVK